MWIGNKVISAPVIVVCIKNHLEIIVVIHYGVAPHFSRNNLIRFRIETLDANIKIFLIIKYTHFSIFSCCVTLNRLPLEKGTLKLRSFPGRVVQIAIDMQGPLFTFSSDKTFIILINKNLISRVRYFTVFKTPSVMIYCKYH